MYGGWGFVGRYGTIKPAWRGHRFWRELGDDVLAFTSALDSHLGVSGAFTRHDDRRFTALVANFDASGEHTHALSLRLGDPENRRWSVLMLGVDGSRRRLESVAVSGMLTVPVDLLPNTAALVRLRARG